MSRGTMSYMQVAALVDRQMDATACSGQSWHVMHLVNGKEASICFMLYSSADGAALMSLFSRGSANFNGEHTLEVQVIFESFGDICLHR